MLGKLLKYELKSTSRLMGVLYLAVLIVAAIVGFLARGTIWQATQGNAIAVVVSGLIYTLLIMTLMIVTVVMILQRFYKNLLKGEGYLMHTLPVPTWMLVASKTISSLIWVLLSIITLIVSVFVLVLTSVAGSGNLFALDWCSLPWGDFFKFFQESAGEIILTIVTAVIQIVRIILLVYTAMAIGAAINLIIAGITNLVKAADEAKKKAVENANAYNNQKKELESLRQKYIEIMDSEKDEATKAKELDTIKNTLAETYGVEKEALDKLNESRQAGLDLMDEEAVKNAKTVINENQAQYNVLHANVLDHEF